MIGDTTPEAARIRWGVLAGLTGEQRLRQALELTDFVLRIHADGRRTRSQAQFLEGDLEALGTPAPAQR